MAQAATPNEAPPKGLKVNRDSSGDQTVHEILFTLPRYRYWISGLALGVPALTIFLSLLDSNSWWLAFYLIGIEAVMGIIFVPDLLRRREVEVNHGYLTLTDYAKYVGPKSETISISSITNVEKRPAKLNTGHEIVITADGDDYRIGAGLTKEALDWLHQYIVFALREAAASGAATRATNRLHRATPAGYNAA